MNYIEHLLPIYWPSNHHLIAGYYTHDRDSSTAAVTTVGVFAAHLGRDRGGADSMNFTHHLCICRLGHHSCSAISIIRGPKFQDNFVLFTFSFYLNTRDPFHA